MFTNHSTLQYLVNKPVLGVKICRWLLLFQEFDFEIIVKPGQLNGSLDHPIAFASRKLYFVQRNYTTTKREGLAMV